MMKRMICLTLVLMLAITAFAGCSAKKDEPSAATSNAPETTAQSQSTQKETQNPNDAAFTITVDSWFLLEDANPDNPVNKNYKLAVEKAYKAKYPNATVQWDLTTSEKYFDLLKAKLASNTADDVFFHQNLLVPFAKGGYLADLTNEPYAGKLLEGTRSGIEFGGKIDAVARSVDGWACWYNKKMFADNGWSAPKTWNEFLTLCDKGGYFQCFEEYSPDLLYNPAAYGHFCIGCRLCHQPVKGKDLQVHLSA